MLHEGTMELRAIVAAIRRWIWLIIGCSLIAGAIAFVVNSRLPPAYRATSTLLVMVARDARVDEYTNLIAGERLALTYSQMLKDRSILQAVIARLGLAETPESLAKRVSAEPVRDTLLVRLTVADASAQQAATLANAIAEEFTNHTKALQEERASTYVASLRAKLLEQAGLVDEAQARVDDLTAQQLTKQAEVAHLQDLLTANGDDYQSLQRDRQALQSSIDQLAGAVRIVDLARPQEAGGQSPYSASALLQLDHGQVVGESAASGVTAHDQLAASYAQMLTSQVALQKVITEQGITETVDSLAKSVKVEPVAGTQLVKLTVTNGDPALAIRLANAIATASTGQIQALLTRPFAERLAGIQEQMNQSALSTKETRVKLEAAASEKLRTETELAREEQRLTQLGADYRAMQQEYNQMGMAAAQAADTVVISERASLPKDQTRSGYLYVLLAAAITAAIAGLIACVIEYLDETIKTPEDISSLLSLSTVGQIGQFARKQDDLLVVHSETPAALAFRRLAANIRFSQADRPVQTLLVTSPTSGEGKSIVAANLAAAFALDGLRVVAVDADMRLARLHELFGLRRADGLAEALEQGAVNGNLQQTRVDGLQVLTGGTTPADPTSLVNSPRLTKVLAELASDADVIVIDTPPVLSIADSTVLAGMADAILLVVRADHTTSRAAVQAVDTLRRANNRLIGVVLNGVAASRNGYYSYNRYHVARIPGQGAIRQTLGKIHWPHRPAGMARHRPTGEG